MKKTSEYVIKAVVVICFAGVLAFATYTIAVAWMYSIIAEIGAIMAAVIGWAVFIWIMNKDWDE